MRFLLPAALLSLPLFAACVADTSGVVTGDDGGDDGAPIGEHGHPTGGYFPADPVAVEVHTQAAQVIFSDPDGRVLTRVSTVDGVARATVDRGSNASAGVVIGHIVLGTEIEDFVRYTIATSLDDGDVIVLDQASDYQPEDLGSLALQLPTLPSGYDVRVFGCQASTVADAASVTLQRHDCPDADTYVAIASLGDEPEQAVIGTGIDAAAHTADLSNLPWKTMDHVAVSLRPAPRDGVLWLTGSGARFDQRSFLWSPMRHTTDARALPIVLDPATTPVVRYSVARTLPHGNALDTAELVVRSTDPLTLDADRNPLRLFQAIPTGEHSLRLDGEVDGDDAALSLEAATGELTSWKVMLRGGDREVTLPILDGVGDIQDVKASLRAETADGVWTREISVDR